MIVKHDVHGLMALGKEIGAGKGWGILEALRVFPGGDQVDGLPQAKYFFTKSTCLKNLDLVPHDF